MVNRKLRVACRILGLIACVAIACSLVPMAFALPATGDAGEGVTLQAGGISSGEVEGAVEAGSMVQASKSDYTLNSNGTLVIHNNLRGLLQSTPIFSESDPKSEIDLYSKDEDIYHMEYPDKKVYAYINPKVKQIVIECDPEKMCR